jgi:hypothetical protein
MPCSLAKVTDISKEHVASIFRVKEQAKQEISVKWAAGPEDVTLHIATALRT